MSLLQARDFEEFARRLVAASESTANAPRDLESLPAIFPDGTRPVALRLEDLPKEVGVLLASVGVLGFVLPGLPGAPALVAGGLVLWPKTFGKVEGWLLNRFPSAHRKSMQQMGRFLDDLDRRFPRPETPPVPTS